MFCHENVAWFFELLQWAAPTLEELKVWDPLEQHLAVVHAMPRLRRLEVRFSNQDPFPQPPLLAALPQPSLKWLRVEYLPRTTTQSLLMAHAPALEVLWLSLGTDLDAEWPVGCGDLDAFLVPCGLRLERLVLIRLYLHDPETCRAQVAAARLVLPGCSVQCDQCDHVPLEDF